jgi:hypothetical protein
VFIRDSAVLPVYLIVINRVCVTKVLIYIIIRTRTRHFVTRTILHMTISFTPIVIYRITLRMRARTKAKLGPVDLIVTNFTNICRAVLELLYAEGQTDRLSGEINWRIFVAFCYEHIRILVSIIGTGP